MWLSNTPKPINRLVTTIAGSNCKLWSFSWTWISVNDDCHTSDISRMFTHFQKDLIAHISPCKTPLLDQWWTNSLTRTGNWRCKTRVMKCWGITNLSILRLTTTSRLQGNAVNRKWRRKSAGMSAEPLTDDLHLRADRGGRYVCELRDTIYTLDGCLPYFEI